MQGYTGALPDEGLHVQFRLDSVLDEKATAENKGIPVFKDVPWVNIRIPGNKDEIIDTVAWLDEGNPHSHLNRFPNAWAKFKANQANTVTGFALKEWPGILKSQVDHLAYFGIHTVEQLANVNDANLQHIIHGLELRTKARAYLEQANSTDTLRSELEALKATLAAMQGKVTVLPPSAEPQVFVAPVVAPEVAVAAVAPKRRGRPPKSQAVQP